MQYEKEYSTKISFKNVMTSTEGLLVQYPQRYFLQFYAILSCVNLILSCVYAVLSCVYPILSFVNPIMFFRL